MSFGDINNRQTYSWSDVSGTLSYQVPTSLTDRVLVVKVSNRTNGNQQVTGVTFGGVALTQAANINNSGAVRSSSWYLVNPPDDAAYDVVVTLSASIQATMTVLVLDGVDQSTVIRTPGTNQEDSVLTGSVTVPSEAGDLVLGCLVVNSSAGASLATLDANQTSTGTPVTASSQTSFVSTRSGAATSVTLTADFGVTARSYAWSGVSYIPASGGGGTEHTQSVSGGLTPSGTVSGEIVTLLKTQSVAGGLTPAGDISQFGFGSDATTGTVGLSGSLQAVRSAHQEDLALTSALAPSGAVTLRLSGKQLVGTLAPSGTLQTDAVQTTPQSMSGIIAPVGSLVARLLGDGAPFPRQYQSGRRRRWKFYGG